MLKGGFVSGYLLSTPIVNCPSRPLLALLCFRFYSLRYISCFNDRFMFQYCWYRLPNRAWWMAHSDPRMPLSCLAIGFCFYLIVLLTFFSLLALETFFDNMVTIRYTYVYPRGLKKKKYRDREHSTRTSLYCLKSKSQINDSHFLFHSRSTGKRGVSSGFSTIVVGTELRKKNNRVLSKLFVEDRNIFEHGAVRVPK